MTEVAASLQPPPIDAGRRLRIAVLSYNLPRPGFKRGGIERVAHEVADGLARRGHHVVVHTHDPRPAGASYDVAPLPWRRFVSTWLGRRLTMGYLGNVLALGARVGDADVIMTHGDSLLLPLRGRPLIRVMHGSALDEARTATSAGRRILQFGVYTLELLTALTERNCVAVSANTVTSNPFIHRVIPNGVDLSTFRPDATVRAAVPTLLFVGAMRGRKRGDWMVSQFIERIRPRFPGAELHMVVPEGPAVEGVLTHTGLTDRALADLYRRAWLFVSPSTYEGFGLPYLEAMASGTPVVATPNPGSREVLDDGRYGVVAGDETFADQIVSLLGDAVSRERLATSGLQRVNAFSLERTIDAYEELVRSVVH
jgi:glycosyltransferase involved in cell wall biosynthesis